jgi:hypothetical protein
LEVGANGKVGATLDDIAQISDPAWPVQNKTGCSR